MSDTSSAAAGKGLSERIQTQLNMIEEDIRYVRTELHKLRDKLETLPEEDMGSAEHERKRAEIKVEIREKEGLLKSLTERATGLEAQMSSGTCPLHAPFRALPHRHMSGRLLLDTLPPSEHLLDPRTLSARFITALILSCHYFAIPTLPPVCTNSTCPVSYHPRAVSCCVEHVEQLL